MSTRITKPVIAGAVIAVIMLFSAYAYFAQSSCGGDDGKKTKTKSVVINIDGDEKNITVTKVENGKKTIEVLEGKEAEEYIKKCGDDYIVMAGSGKDKAVITKTKVIAISGSDSTSTDQMTIDLKNIIGHEEVEKEVEKAMEEAGKAIRETVEELKLDSLLNELDIDVKVKKKKGGGRSIIINIK